MFDNGLLVVVQGVEAGRRTLVASGVAPTVPALALLVRATRLLGSQEWEEGGQMVVSADRLLDLPSGVDRTAATNPFPYYEYYFAPVPSGEQAVTMLEGCWAYRRVPGHPSGSALSSVGRELAAAAKIHGRYEASASHLPGGGSLVVVTVSPIQP